MTDLPSISILETDLDAIASTEGHIAVFIPEDGKLDQLARRVNRLTKGALARFVASAAFSKMKPGDAHLMAWPAGLAADGIVVSRLNRRPAALNARKAGANVVAALPRGGKVLMLLGSRPRADDAALGALLRAYRFDTHQTDEDRPAPIDAALMVSKPGDLALETTRALASGIYFTRDLVNEPSNILTTTEFATRLEALADLGLKVTTLDEPELEALGMRTLLGVGQGSESPSKVVVMEWQGGGDEAPLALVGKGVVFDTGGISIKPAAGMEEMTMDMGGAGTVAGVMKSLALAKTPANVVGLVGLVENMPDGRAQRPGDVVRSMKGDTVEVINTDAEGRLVLADVLWHAQEAFKPSAVIDLATLTGAIIVALGHENAGVFSNDDELANAFLKAAKTEGEGAWRMPLGPGYAKKLESRIADMKNVGNRWGGSVTAAEFLRKFVKDDMPWIHLDIAGVALPETPTPLAPKGASGWGVLALNRLIADRISE